MRPQLGVARDAGSRLLFMDHGRIVEQDEPRAVFAAPQNERTRQFLAQGVPAVAGGNHGVARLDAMQELNDRLGIAVFEGGLRLGRVTSSAQPPRDPGVRFSSPRGRRG